MRKCSLRRPDKSARLAAAADDVRDRLVGFLAVLRPDAAVEQMTCDLLEQAGALDGFLIGITEDMPPDRWPQSCRAIMAGIERHAREHPARYACD